MTVEQGVAVFGLVAVLLSPRQRPARFTRVQPMLSEREVKGIVAENHDGRGRAQRRPEGYSRTPRQIPSRSESIEDLS